VIAKDTVEQALEFMGFRKFSKQDYLVELQRRFDIDDDRDDESSAPTKEETEPHFPECENRSQLPPHRAVYPPFIRLPQTLHDDSLVLGEINDDDLLGELLEEEELDRMDGMLDGMHEKGLWERFRDRMARTNNIISGLDVDEEPSPGPIRSKVYISDSD
jgi:hypothetical protein